MTRRHRSLIAGVLFIVFVLIGACSSSGEGPVDAAAAGVPAVEPTETSTGQPTVAPTAEPALEDHPSTPKSDTDAEPMLGRFATPPEVRDGPLDPETADAVDTLLGERLLARQFDDMTFTAIRTIGSSGDVRAAWWLTDLLRIARSPDLSATISGSLAELMGVGFDPFDAWGDAVDHLIAWDIPAPPDYLDYKRNVYLVVEPRWEPLFVETADVDWRLVSWGGVLIDDRPFDQTEEPCNCIPASDNPRTTSAADGDAWLDDDTIVFGVSIGDEARAYPRSIMEVREMVNDTLGGRDFAMPYCTLCGSAQVFFTDDLPGDIARPVLRTSGLLSRSNKVMYDVESWSLFDTFRGRAVSGPLLDAGIELNQHSVITTTWREWKTAYPQTTVLAIEEALGRPNSDLRNTRDGDGPIFPIGSVDPRLPVQRDVLGVFTADGSPLAFDVADAIETLGQGDIVERSGIMLALDGGGVQATTSDGEAVPSHQAFWFAWSQFHPDTDLWTG